MSRTTTSTDSDGGCKRSYVAGDTVENNNPNYNPVPAFGNDISVGCPREYNLAVPLDSVRKTSFNICK